VTDSPSLICPFCGTLQRAGDTCAACATPLDAETRRQTLARMGPWFIRSDAHPFMPGCSWEQIAAFISSGMITRDSIVRGPTTRQLWRHAPRVQGIAHLLGLCHACQAKVDPAHENCRACRASFGAPLDRNALGIPTEEEETHAHLDAPGAARLSSFATNDELREGLHDEIRRRRTLGGTTGAKGAAGASVAPTSRASPFTGARDSDSSARRRVPAWLVIGATVATIAIVAIVSGTLALASSGRSAQEVTAPAIADPADGDAPIVGELESSVALVEPAPVVPATTTTPAAPPPAPAPAPTDPFLAIDAALQRARDGAVSRSDRSSALDEVAALIEALDPGTVPTGSRGVEALAQRRARLDDERRRLAAEVFLRGEGGSP